MNSKNKKSRDMAATMNPAKNSNTRYCYYYNTLCVKCKRISKGGCNE